MSGSRWALDPHEVFDLGAGPQGRLEGCWRILGCPACGAHHFDDEECPRLTIAPLSLREANAWVEEHHRHHGSTQGHKFSVGLLFGEELAGVAIAGRPVGRHDDDGLTIEVRRVATRGTFNGCSKLYGALCNAAKALGFHRVITFTLPEEGGGSLRAAGFRLIRKTTSKRGWNRESRPRTDKAPLGQKLRWERTLQGGGE